MTNNLNQQIKQQFDQANQVDVECKKLEMELKRYKEEVQLKTNELDKLNDDNNMVKSR